MNIFISFIRKKIPFKHLQLYLKQSYMCFFYCSPSPCLVYSRSYLLQVKRARRNFWTLHFFCFSFGHPMSIRVLLFTPCFLFPHLYHLLIFFFKITLIPHYTQNTFAHTICKLNSRIHEFSNRHQNSVM